jgi:uncharacterized phage infection (PIP) family protein YhgE
MRIQVRFRRPFVVVGVVLALVAGAASIRAAAAWTAAAAPLAARPPSIESLQVALANEQARSAALRAQLDELTAGSADLTNALTVARDRIATDATQAGKLQASLTAAKTKLSALEASIRRARAAATGAAPAPASRAPTALTGGEPEGNDGD